MSFERLEPGTTEWVAFHANHLARYRFAVDALGADAPRRILDAACGVGYGSRHLAEALGADVVGVDQSAHALDIARRDFGSNAIVFLEDDCETLAAAAGEPFDAVVTFETLEHLKHPDRFLRAAATARRRDGRLVASVPNTLVNPSTDWECHLHEFDAAALEALLREAGFEEVRLHGQYLTAVGRLRQQMRAEVNRVRFNPFWRLGAWLQRVLGRGLPLTPPLPEQPEDFEIRPLDAATAAREGAGGPFVLLATARKGRDAGGTHPPEPSPTRVH